MAIQFGTTVRNSFLDDFVAEVGASAKLRFYTGASPATAAAAATGTMLFDFTLPPTWMNAASGGQATKAGTWSANSLATGTIGYFRLLNNAATVTHMQGSVSQAFSLTTSSLTSANSNILNFASTSGVTAGMSVAGAGIPAGTTVLAVTATTVSMSQASTAGVSSGTQILFGNVTGDINLGAVIVTGIGQNLVIDQFTIVAPGA
jgi:hypothetical protein